MNRQPYAKPICLLSHHGNPITPLCVYADQDMRDLRAIIGSVQREMIQLPFITATEPSNWSLQQPMECFLDTLFSIFKTNLSVFQLCIAIGALQCVNRPLKLYRIFGL
mmetsp:Transcript_19750/g.27138  ORF Transcript_19750/g.27138 Transcript_19750/m.27138 type:complete len:108 (+) Transcript_19750:419-742(+)